MPMLTILFYDDIVFPIPQVIYSDEERKFNKEITVGLIRSELLNLAEYNIHLAKLIDGGRNSMSQNTSILFGRPNNGLLWWCLGTKFGCCLHMNCVIYQLQRMFLLFYELGFYGFDVWCLKHCLILLLRLKSLCSFTEAATEFAISLVQTLVVQEPGVSMSELYNLIDALTKVILYFCFFLSYIWPDKLWYVLLNVTFIPAAGNEAWVAWVIATVGWDC